MFYFVLLISFEITLYLPIKSPLMVLTLVKTPFKPELKSMILKPILTPFSIISGHEFQLTEYLQIKSFFCFSKLVVLPNPVYSY